MLIWADGEGNNTHDTPRSRSVIGEVVHGPPHPADNDVISEFGKQNPPRLNCVLHLVCCSVSCHFLYNDVKQQQQQETY